MSTTLHTVGMLNGCLFNQYALDIFEGNLRVATTILSFWSFAVVDENSAFPKQQLIFKNYITILEIPGDTGKALEVVGITEIFGKDGEDFTSIYFFEKIAYAYDSSIDATNPFHFVNVTDPTNPKVVGLLEISNFSSSYVYSMTGDNTLLVVLGREINDFGLELAVIDALDPVMPVVVQRYVVETDKGSLSFSAVRYDTAVFQYLSLGLDFGLVILSINIFNTTESSDILFDGFIVFDVSRDGISERFQISQVSSDYRHNHGKSLVFNGNLMTMKGNSTLSTNLDSGKIVWQSTFG